MDYFAGLDVSVKETSVCIVDDAGKIVREARVASEPEALLQVLTNTICRLKRVGLEHSSRSIPSGAGTCTSLLVMRSSSLTATTGSSQSSKSDSSNQEKLGAASNRRPPCFYGERIEGQKKPFTLPRTIYRGELLVVSFAPTRAFGLAGVGASAA